MAGWLILVDVEKDFPNAETPHKVVSTKDYLGRPHLFRGDRAKIINLSRSFAYQGRGYYASLLGEARRHRIIPTVETMLDLSTRKAYENAIPELEDVLNSLARKHGSAPERVLLCFGECREPQWERFGRLVFDWFRAPIIEVTFEAGEWTRIERMRPLPINKLAKEERAFFCEALDRYTRRDWRDTRQKAPPRFTFAVLHDPNEVLPPSSKASLKHLARVAEKMDVEIDLVTKKDLPRLCEYDALFIRETTSIRDHTFRFAQRARQEGIPVIDDPVSMIRCTNKLYLKELMESAGIAMPQSVMLASAADIAAAEAELGYPVVVKIPDGSFSRGVKKAENREEFEALAADWFKQTDLLIAQKFMPTSFDWRIGVLGGEPLFACQYMMAKKHWQIVNHDRSGKPVEGSFKSFPLHEAPAAVLETGVRAACLIGNGFYGVDIKETPDGVFVIEVNDNPNLDHGVEDVAGKDEVWRKLIGWFIDRIERRRG
ncbi:RimK family protein [Tepidamorphus sp. 3E244]|uniref:RimK family protein n=1 Tax=Tepidamorphus sp. 3E244 TaxID=3385498 RepID=UPI0038FCCAFA